MTISSSTIAAIQKLGAQAFAAKEKLVASTNDYAEKVNAAMKKNPHDPAIAGLQTAWQAVAQIAKSLENIEDELAKAYAAASRLVKSDPLKRPKRKLLPRRPVQRLQNRLTPPSKRAAILTSFSSILRQYSTSMILLK